MLQDLLSQCLVVLLFYSLQLLEERFNVCVCILNTAMSSKLVWSSLVLKYNLKLFCIRKFNPQTTGSLMSAICDMPYGGNLRSQMRC